MRKVTLRFTGVSKTNNGSGVVENTTLVTDEARNSRGQLSLRRIEQEWGDPQSKQEEELFRFHNGLKESCG